MGASFASWYLIRASCVGTASLALAGCNATVTFTEQDVFSPLESSRRPLTAPLTINAEDRLTDRAEIRHYRVPTKFGTMAVTHAVTGSDRTLVRCGGNMADRVTDGAAYISSLLPLGDVMIFDYPGYGDSEGEAIFEDIIIGAQSMADFSARAAPDTTRVAWGHSIGGFVCAAMTGSRPDDFDAIVLEATAPSFEAALDAWVPSWIGSVIDVEVASRLRDATIPGFLATFDGPILVMTAGRDTQIPSALGYDLSDQLAADGHTVMHHHFPNATHGQIASQDAFVSTVEYFLDHLQIDR